MTDTMKLTKEQIALIRKQHAVIGVTGEEVEALCDMALAHLASGGCKWDYDSDEDSWDADCGLRFCITDGTPPQNDMKYCPGCGKPIVIPQLPEK